MQIALHSNIRQNIKSLGVSGVRSLAFVDKTVMSFTDRASPNLEHSFYVRCVSFLKPTLVAMVTKISKFLTQNWF